jgi:uncharacterized protein
MKTTKVQSPRIMAKIVKLTETLPIYFYVPIAYLILIGLFIPTFYLGEWLDLPETDYSKLGLPDNIWYRFLIVAIFAPLIETFFFQAMPYYFLNLFEFMKRHVWITILLPAVVFGCLHMYSLQYVIEATMMGIVFQFTYHARSKKGDPFLSTFLLHVLLNGMSITMQLFG